MADVRRGWSNSPIGFRDARLESSDFSAGMALAVAGIPALLVGAELVGFGLEFAQLLIAAPLGAIVGAGIVGLAGRQAAASAAPGAFLYRAPLGSIGAALFNLVRLFLTLSWTTLILDISSGWIESAADSFGLTLPRYVAPGVIAALAVALFVNGISWSFNFLRRRLFALMIVLTLFMLWRLLARLDPLGGEPLTQGFPEAVDALLGLAILWSSLGADAGGHGHREDETASGLGFGYAVATLAFVLAGAALSRGGSLDVLGTLGSGTLVAILLMIWVVVMEVDGAGGLLASSTVSIQTLLRPLPSIVGLLAAAGAAVVGAEMLDAELIRKSITVATLAVGPAVAILLVDAYLINPGGYRSDELFRWRGDYGTFNWFGVATWLGGIALGLWLRPDLEIIPGGPAIGPALLLGMLVAALLYWPLGKFRQRGRSTTFEVRGV